MSNIPNKDITNILTNILLNYNFRRLPHNKY